MIPKILHCCWFGKNPKPKLVRKCINSWKKFCSDYRIMEWTENNYDIDLAPKYVRDAYNEKKWAFVADYVRLEMLVQYGGVYLDTDVELIGSLDLFLNNKGFLGSEDGMHVSTAVMGCEKDNLLIRQFKEQYNSLSFRNSDGSLNMTTNVVLMTDFFKKKGYKPQNVFQMIDEFSIYPSEYFYPLSIDDAILRKTNKTVAIHWFAGSWVNNEKKKKRKKRQLKNRLKPKIVALIGKERFEYLKKVFRYRNND